MHRSLASVLTGALIAMAAVVGIAAPASAAGPALTTTTTVVPGEKVSVSIAGTGFEVAPQYPGQATKHAYVAIVAKGDLSVDQATTPNGAFDVSAAGEISGTLEADAATLDRTIAYEVISWPSRSFPSAATLLARADIAIDWDALFPAPAQQTSTTLAVSPTGTAVEGAEVSLTATVAPAAAGTVTFSDGAGPLGSAPVEGGVATLKTSSLAVGVRSLAASFAPADTESFTASSSDAVAYTVTAKPTVPVDPEPEEPAQPQQASVVVSKTTGLNPAGETVTVTGSGFLPNAPATSGTRPPLMGTFTGAYVVFGSFADSWKPSEKAPSDARKVVAQKWALLAADAPKVGGAAAGAVVVSPDGTFSTELVLTQDDAKAIANGTWGVYTYAAGGAVYAPFETATPVTFAAAPVEPQPEPEPEPQPGPKVAVTPSTALDPARDNVLTVTGTGFTGPGAANGAYVLFGETSVWSGTVPPSADGWLVSAHVPAASIENGAFSITLTVPAGALDPSKSYQVATSAAHGLSVTDRSLDTFTPVVVAQPSQPFVGFPQSATVQPGGTLQIVGGGFAPGDLVTATAFSEPVVIGTATADAAGRVSFSWAVPASFAAGAHTLELSVNGVAVASAPFSVVAAIVPPAVEVPAAQPSCVARSVSGATIQWGVKESFRSYITGPIAKGEISGGWGTGSGAFSPENDRGRVSFGGAVHYTGHGGLLDVTLSNPRVQITGQNTASLILNVQSKGFNGSPDVNANGVVFANLSLPAATESAGRVSWNGAGATLTAAGAEAFAGFYEAGDALDSVSFTFPLGAEVACDGTTDATLAATGGEAPAGALWLGVGTLLLGALALSIARRRVEA